MPVVVEVAGQRDRGVQMGDRQGARLPGPPMPLALLARRSRLAVTSHDSLCLRLGGINHAKFGVDLFW